MDGHGIRHLPLLVFARRAIARGAYPVFDDALIALRIHDVFSRHPPTLGAGTSFGRIAVAAHANHPGPLPFYVLAPIYRLFGFRPTGMIMALLALNVASLIVLSVLTRRLGGVRLTVLTMGAVLLLERSFGEDVFTRPFNPYLGLLLFLAFIVAIWAAVSRSPWYLMWAIVLGSIAVQSQVAFGGAVGLLLLFAIALIAWRGVRGTNRPHIPSSRVAWHAIAWSIALGVLCWLPPIDQQLTATDSGNLSRLWKWLTEGGQHATVGTRQSAAIVGQIVPLPYRLADLGPASMARARRSCARRSGSAAPCPPSSCSAVCSPSRSRCAADRARSPTQRASSSLQP